MNNHNDLTMDETIKVIYFVKRTDVKLSLALSPITRRHKGPGDRKLNLEFFHRGTKLIKVFLDNLGMCDGNAALPGD